MEVFVDLLYDDANVRKRLQTTILPLEFFFTYMDKKSMNFVDLVCCLFLCCPFSSWRKCSEQVLVHALHFQMQPFVGLLLILYNYYHKALKNIKNRNKS